MSADGDAGARTAADDRFHQHEFRAAAADTGRHDRREAGRPSQGNTSRNLTSRKL